jgi:YfiH family protein
MPLFSASKSRIAAVDQLLAEVGMQHGRRQLLSAGYVSQARHPRQEAPPLQEKAARRERDMQVFRAQTLLNAGIKHGFSSRAGGVSSIYDGADAANGDLNVGFTPSDIRDNVLENRGRLLDAVFGAEAERNAHAHRRLITLRQVHSGIIHRVGLEQPPLAGDGLMTDEPGVAIGILTADCVPILVADRKLRAVAAFHAGWKGTLRRIVETGIGRMRLEFGSDPEDLVAAIGPSIGQCCYGIGEEVEHEFRSQFSYADALFCEVFDSDPVRKKYPMLFLSQRAPGHSDLGPSLHLDLQEANRRQLVDAGVPDEGIGVVAKCTSCRTDLFFSHRAEHGFTGRMLAVISPG